MSGVRHGRVFRMVDLFVCTVSVTKRCPKPFVCTMSVTKRCSDVSDETLFSYCCATVVLKHFVKSPSFFAPPPVTRMLCIGWAGVGW